MLSLLSAVQILNNPGRNARVPKDAILPATWFSAAELQTLQQLKTQRLGMTPRSKPQTLDWAELEVRQILFLRGILCKSFRDVGKELGMSLARVTQKYNELCDVYGLIDEVED